MSSEDQPRFVQPGQFGAQLLPDLYLVSWLGMSQPRIDCHVYVLRSRDGLLLIDCGTPWGYERIVRNMEHWGLNVADVKTVLVTHGHVDHVTGGYFFKQRGVEFLSHIEAVTITESQWEACGMMDEHGQAYRVDRTLNEGDRISRYGFDVQVFHTPGHSRGCLSFLIEISGARCLFSGDLVMGNALPGWPGDSGFDASALAHHVQRLGEMKFDHLCYGHGVILHDRGELFAKALAQRKAGAWDARIAAR